MSTATSAGSKSRFAGPFAVAALLLVLAAGFPAGCGGAKQLYRSAPLAREIELNRKATAAFERGESEQALALYREALQISRAIEHVDGVAVNLLNLASVYRTVGSRAEAIRALDEILAQGRPVFSSAHRSAAAYLRALLAIDDGDAPAGERWAGEALALCRAATCGKEGRIVNVQARTAFLAGDLPRALDLAAQALHLNREADAGEEIANALRTIADARTVLGDLAEAEKYYTDALVLDKKHGLSVKIRLDLIRLGDVVAGSGRSDEAAAYYRRAYDVSQGAADEAGMAEAQTRIRDLRGAAPP